MTTSIMKITVDWARKRELPLVHQLYDLARPRNSAGEIDSWPDELLASTEEPLGQVCMTNTMIFRTADGGPRKISAACTYGLSTRGTEMTVLASRWAVCPDMTPNEQKILSRAVFTAMEGKLNTGGNTVTVVSEYDLWRQIILRHCGFSFITAVDIQKFDRPMITMYRFSKVKE